MSKKGETVKLKNYAKNKRSHHLWFMLILKVIWYQKKNGKQNSDESYTNKYQNHVGCSYRYKLTCVDNQLSK